VCSRSRAKQPSGAARRGPALQKTCGPESASRTASASDGDCRSGTTDTWRRTIRKKSGDQDSSHVLHLGVHPEEQRRRKKTLATQIKIFLYRTGSLAVGVLTGVLTLRPPQQPLSLAPVPRHHRRRAHLRWPPAICNGGADASSHASALWEKPRSPTGSP
jgi:hypothetical protein